MTSLKIVVSVGLVVANAGASVNCNPFKLSKRRNKACEEEIKKIFERREKMKKGERTQTLIGWREKGRIKSQEEERKRKKGNE